MKSMDETFTLEENIEAGEHLAGEVYRLAFAPAYAAIAMQEPLSDDGPSPMWGVDLKKRAEAVMKKEGVQLMSSEYVTAKYNIPHIEAYLCKLPRSEPVDLAIEVLQKWWYHGVKKTAKNSDYYLRMLAFFKSARSAHEQVMVAVRAAFAGTRVSQPWEESRYVTRLLASVEDE